MKERTLRQRLAAHIAVRLVVATVLLGSAVVVQLRDAGRAADQPVLLSGRPDLRGQPRLHRVAALRRPVAVADRRPLRASTRHRLGRGLHHRRRRQPLHDPLHAADRRREHGAVPPRRLAARGAQQHPVRRPGGRCSTSTRSGNLDAAVRDLVADGPAAGQRGAIHGGAQRLRVLRGRVAQRIARRARPARRSAARAGHRRDCRPAGVQPVRARQPAERPGDRRRRTTACSPSTARRC